MIEGVAFDEECGGSKRVSGGQRDLLLSDVYGQRLNRKRRTYSGYFPDFSRGGRLKDAARGALSLWKSLCSHSVASAAMALITLPASWGGGFAVGSGTSGPPRNFAYVSPVSMSIFTHSPGGSAWPGRTRWRIFAAKVSQCTPTDTTGKGALS